MYYLTVLATALIVSFIHWFLSKNYKRIRNFIKKRLRRWKPPFEKVQIKSSLDNKLQNAYFYKTTNTEKTPLVVSLHSWAGDYTQYDVGVADLVIKKDFNYIYPNFRGRNDNPDACASDLAISDINDAIQFAIDNGNVDQDNIFVIGGSGGAHATLSFYPKTKHRIKAYIAWNPITDLIEWFHQSKNRNSRYSDDILKVTHIDSESEFNERLIKERSPIHQRTPQTNSDIHLFAGYHDGYKGSVENPVPITHTLNYFNKLVLSFGGNQKDLIPQELITKLATKSLPLTEKTINDNREIVYQRKFKNINLTIFNGNHEQIESETFDIIESYLSNNKREVV